MRAAQCKTYGREQSSALVSVMVTNRAGREYTVAAATTSKASLNLSQAPNVPGRLGLYSLPYRGTAVSFFPLSITDKDNRHAGVLGPLRETKYHLKDHLDATSRITCAPPPYVDLGCHCMQKLSSYPFKGHQYSADQKCIPFMPFSDNSTHLHYWDTCLCWEKVQASNTVEYWNRWHEHPT